MERIESLVVNRVGYIRLNNPPVNGYNKQFMEELYDVIMQLEKDAVVKVVIIQSTLERCFSAGADIHDFATNSVDENKEMVIAARKVSGSISKSTKLYIAAINGHALGGGLELAMACDFRLGAEGDYKIGLPEIKLGLVPGNGGTIRFIRLIGASKALELLVTGDSITPQQAFNYGLFNQIYPKDEFERGVQEWAESIAQGPGLAYLKLKEGISLMTNLSLDDALALEEKLVSELYNTKDAREGFTAFIEKRKPNFE